MGTRNPQRDSPKGIGGKIRASTSWLRGQKNGRDFFFTWRFTTPCVQMRRASGAPASRQGRGHFAQNDTCGGGGDFDVRLRHPERAKKRMPG
jgi:hypothetical protein